MKTYLVGGAVRDKLLGLPVKDRDWVVVGATPEQLLARGFRPVGRDFPVFLHPETGEEYALARTERKSARGYKGFTFQTSTAVTLEQDLKRRDLTINAIAEDEAGRRIDPFNGVADLKRGILRHVSAAFVEDPLRVLRVARFAATFGFKIAAETRALLRAISASGELDTLTPERVWAEFEKALGGGHPTRFILTLRDSHALKILFPEIDILFGVPQPAEYHPEIDAGLHTLMSLNQAARLSADPVVRFAALLHDLGKGNTPRAELPRHPGHEARGARLVEQLCGRYRIPKKYAELAAIVARFHLDCHRVRELRAGSVLKKLEQLDAFRRPRRFQQFLLACEADARGRTGFEDRAYPQADYFRQALAAANRVDTALLQAEELTGKALGDAIRRERITKIKALMSR